MVGILSTGNIMPLSKMDGNISIIAETKRATNCVFATVEMRIPSDSATMMYTPETMTTQKRLPAIGTSKMNLDIKRVQVKMKNANNRYGTTLAMIIIKGLIGLTKSTSIVPRSFSLTMLMLVIIAQISIKSIPMIPGTKL